MWASPSDPLCFTLFLCVCAAVSPTDQTYRDVLCWMQLCKNHVASRFKLLHLQNAAQCCVNALAGVSTALISAILVLLWKSVKSSFTEKRTKTLKEGIFPTGCNLWFWKKFWHFPWNVKVILVASHEVHLCVVCSSPQLWCSEISCLLSKQFIPFFFFPWTSLVLLDKGKNSFQLSKVCICNLLSLNR